MARKDRLVIIIGTDRSPLVRLRNPKNGDPINLTDATKIQVSLDKRDRTKLVLDNTLVPAVQAQFQDSDTQITIVADNAGAGGNDIILQFNAVDDLDTIINAYNTANPTATVSHNGNGDEVLVTQTARLSGGYDEYTPVEVWGDPVLGKVILNLLERDTQGLKRGPNQTFTVTVDFGTFPGGSRIKGFYTKLDVLAD